MLTRMLLLLSLVFSGIASAETENWELARDRDGIKVWTREVSGSPLRAFKAVMTVKSTLGGLVNLILDTDSASRWVYRTDRIQLLRRDVEHASFIIRVETDFPWPLMDRDVVMAGSISQDEKNAVVTIQSRSIITPEFPENPAFLRMPEMEGTWIFRPLGGDIVEVTMIGRANPGGHVPSGIVNLIIDETPFRTMQGMRRVLPEPRYQRTPLPQIRELAKFQ